MAVHHALHGRRRLILPATLVAVAVLAGGVVAMVGAPTAAQAPAEPGGGGMMCDRCGKRPAAVKYIEIEEGVKRSRWR